MCSNVCQANRHERLNLIVAIVEKHVEYLVGIPMDEHGNKLSWECITHKSILMMNSTHHKHKQPSLFEHSTMKIFRAFKEFKCSTPASDAIESHMKYEMAV